MTSFRAMSSAARTVPLALAGYLALAVAYTWPLAPSAGSLIPHDVGDPVLNTWILWWNAFHWPLTDAWWNAPIFFPAQNTLAFSEHLTGLSPIATPIIRLSDNPLLAYNLCLLLTFALSATAAFALVLDLTGRRDAAALAGLAFGFSPYRLAQLSHLQVLAAYWIPIALLALHRYARTGRRRWLLTFWTAFVMQSLTNGYYLAFLSVLVGLWLIWTARPSTWRRALAVVATWLAGGIALLPFLLTYRDTHLLYGLERNLENMRFYSADVAAAISGSSLLRLWRLPAYGTLEGALFCGVTAAALLAAGVVRAPATARSRTRLAEPGWAFYVCAACVFYLLALGPSPSLYGTSLDIPGPYYYLAALPGFASLRVPARMGILFTLCVAVAAGLGFSRLSAAWSARRRLAAAATLAVLIAIESWPRAIPLWDPPARWDLPAAEGQGALIVLPILNELNEAGSMYRAMSHGRTLVNGYSGHVPPWYMTLKEALNGHDPAVLSELAGVGVTHAAVVLRNDPDAAWREFVRSQAAPTADTGNQPFALFNLRAASPPPPGVSVPVVAVHASAHPELTPTLLDGRRDTWWSTLAPQAGGEELLIGLGEGHQVSGMTMMLTDGFEFPRRLEVATSSDASMWEPAWDAPTAGLAAGALMRDPARPVVRLSFRPRAARWIRLRQTGSHRSAAWTIGDLQVLGPPQSR